MTCLPQGFAFPWWVFLLIFSILLLQYHLLTEAFSWWTYFNIEPLLSSFPYFFFLLWLFPMVLNTI
jgi:hypothetical protein